MADSEFRELPICRGRLVTLIDAADFDWLSQWKWHVSDGYVLRQTYPDGRRNRAVVIMMARLIMNPPVGLMVDHINGNKVDNRRCNLRLVTHRENAMNSIKRNPWASSRFKGVCLDRDRKDWRASIQIDGKRVLLGNFTSELEAAHAYDQAARRYFGEYARLNFPDGLELNS